MPSGLAVHTSMSQCCAARRRQQYCASGEQPRVAPKLYSIGYDGKQLQVLCLEEQPLKSVKGEHEADIL